MTRFNKRFCEENRITFDYSNLMQGAVLEQGITDEELSFFEKKAKKAFKTVKENRGTKMMGWTELPYNQKEVVEEIIKTAKDIKKKFDYFVVLGIGGSALGPTAVFNALNHLHHNDLPKYKRKAPKFYVEDNVDPERMGALLDVIDLDKTMFNVITKSGATSETMAQFLIILDLLKKKFKDKANEHIIATTSETKGNLIKIAKEENIKTFYIPEGVGGRFSELCPVGLLPAAVLNVDIKELLAGAKYMDKLCKEKDLYKNPALMSASLEYLHYTKGKVMSVMMPYSDALKYVADWYAQLWGESLGKEVDKNGNIVNVGSTPIKTLGVTDQHSQVQLYREGPFDKVITFLEVEEFRTETNIPHGLDNIKDVAFLSGHTMNELINIEKKATEYALTSSKRANSTIILPRINAFTVGELLYFFEMKTAFMGELLNIDTYNQPGVEGGKIATYALLGREGFSEEAKKLANINNKNEKYVI